VERDLFQNVRDTKALVHFPFEHHRFAGGVDFQGEGFGSGVVTAGRFDELSDDLIKRVYVIVEQDHARGMLRGDVVVLLFLLKGIQ
jgi:hypothetical protein